MKLAKARWRTVKTGWVCPRDGDGSVYQHRGCDRVTDKALHLEARVQVREKKAAKEKP